MSNPAAFGASYSDWKLIRTRECVQIIFEVPLEAADHAYKVLGGMPNNGSPAWFGIAPLKPGTEKRERKSWDELPYAQQAAMSCNDPVFRAFLRENNLGADDADQAAQTVRIYCSVSSRAEIIKGSPSGDFWEDLSTRLQDWKIADRVRA